MNDLISTLVKFTAWANSSQAMLYAVRSDIASAAGLLDATFFESAYNTFIPIAIELSIIYFLIELIETATSGKMTMEVIVKDLMKLALTVMIIQNAFDLLKYVANFGDELCTALIKNEGAFNSNFVNSYTDNITNNIEGIAALINLIPAVLKWLALVICSKLIVYGRSIELGVYLSLSPLAFPSIVSQGMDGDAFKYIKKYAAICLQGAIIGLTIIIGTRINNAKVLPEINMGSGEFIANIGGGLIMYLCLLYMLFQSRRIANEVLGVQ